MGLEEDCQLQVNIHGLAYSLQRVVLVERAPRIDLEHVVALQLKMEKLE